MKKFILFATLVLAAFSLGLPAKANGYTPPPNCATAPPNVSCEYNTLDYPEAKPAQPADPFGVIIVPKQRLGTTFVNPSTDVGASLRVASIGALALSGVALYNDTNGIRYGATVGVHLFSSTELSGGYTYDFAKRAFSKPFLGFTARL